MPDSTNTPALPELEISESNAVLADKLWMKLLAEMDALSGSEKVDTQFAYTSAGELLAAHYVTTLQALSEACKERDEAVLYGTMMKNSGNGLYNAIWPIVDEYHPLKDHRDSEWDVLPGGIRLVIEHQKQRAEKAEAELTEARTLLANQAAGMRRLIDLVRHQRGELFAEQLISAEELAALVADSESGQRVARLESYDAMREKIKYQAAEIATLREKDAK